MGLGPDVSDAPSSDYDSALSPPSESRASLSTAAGSGPSAPASRTPSVAPGHEAVDLQAESGLAQAPAAHVVHASGLYSHRHPQTSSAGGGTDAGSTSDNDSQPGAAAGGAGTGPHYRPARVAQGQAWVRATRAAVTDVVLKGLRVAIDEGEVSLAQVMALLPASRALEAATSGPANVMDLLQVFLPQGEEAAGAATPGRPTAGPFD